MKIDGRDSKVFLQEIVFQEDGDFSTVQLMRTGKFMHPFFDDFEITEDMFKSFKKNFGKKVKKVDIAVDFSHNSGDVAAGWIREVILREKNTELWIKVEWTPEARQKILDKEFRYMSADFTTNFVDNETGKKFGPTLNGGALTNRPFIKDMQAVLSDIDMPQEKRQAIREILNDEPIEKDTDQMNAKEVKEYIATLSDEEKIAQGFVEIKEVEVQLSDDESKAKVEKLEKENKQLSEDAETSAKEAEFSKLLSDGKAVEAQRVAFMDGDMTKFAEQAVKLNTEVKGNGEDGSDHDKDKDKKDEPKTFDEACEKANDLVNVMLSENKGMKFDEAHKKVLSDNPDIEKIMEAA